MKKFSKQTLALLTLILLLAAFVRFYRLDLKMRFIWDEGRDMSAIHKMITQRNITLFGPYNDIGGTKDFFGVFHYYLMAPSLLLANYDPLGPAIFTATLGVLSVLLLFFLINRWSTTKVALLVSYFYAISPLVIKYVQWPWNPNTIPFFSFLYLLILTKIIKDGDKKLLFSGLAGLILGILFQLHYFTIPLGIMYLIIFLKEKKKNFINLVVFSLCFILPNLSFVVFDLTHDFFYFKILKDSFFSGTDQQYFSFQIINFIIIPFKFVFELLNGIFFENKFLALILELAFFIMIFINIQHLFSKKDLDLKMLISAVWLCFFVMIGFFPTLFNEYHSSFLWFSFFWFFIDFFGHSKLTMIVYVLISLMMIKSIDLNREPIWSENLPQIRNLGEIVSRDYINNFSGKKVNLASLTDSDTRGIRYKYFLQKNGIKVDGIDQYPIDEILYVISPHGIDESVVNPAWELDSFRKLEWIEIGEVNGVYAYRVEK